MPQVPSAVAVCEGRISSKEAALCWHGLFRGFNLVRAALRYVSASSRKGPVSGRAAPERWCRYGHACCFLHFTRIEANGTARAIAIDGSLRCMTMRHSRDQVNYVGIRIPQGGGLEREPRACELRIHSFFIRAPYSVGHIAA